MAYREIAMWEILAVLRRVARGEGHRAIARVPGHSRSTIRRWLRGAEALGWEPATGGEPEEPLAVAVAQRVRPVRTSAEPGASQARLWRHREQIRAWLEPAIGERGLRLAKVRELLARQGVDVPYSSLHRFAVAHCGFARSRRTSDSLSMNFSGIGERAAHGLAADTAGLGAPTRGTILASWLLRPGAAGQRPRCS